ncbi:MAG: flagellar basal body P-ring protein FlgI [Planctomycetaceae bacterium]|nr:flagellar basal body P-ring protein FlgI [Planctomycetaceae bacterium]
MNRLKIITRKPDRHHSKFLISHFSFIIFCLSSILYPLSCNAQQLIGTVARVKGQEPTVIHGYGIVTGLRGTGDKPGEFKETARVLRRMMQLTGHPEVSEKEIGASKNVALVKVIATIPPQGGRSGEMLDITVSSVGSASSLKDGILDLTDLIGPVPQSPEMTQILAKAWGPLILEKSESPTVAKVIGGARLTADFRNPYIKDGCITLVLPERYASFFMADAIANAINGAEAVGGNEDIATALDQGNISVKIPFADITNPVQFLARINAIEIFDVDKIPTVAINERTGAIVIDPSVEIAPVAISHKNISVQAGGRAGQPQQQDQTPNKWVKIDLEERRGGETNVKLQALVDSLNMMKVPPQDMIDIIRTIDSKGDLYGKIQYVK